MGERRDMPYAHFVKGLYTCIKEYSHCADFSPAVFAEGPEARKKGYSGTQEYAILRNGYARTFFQAAAAWQAGPAPCAASYELQRSPLYPDEVKIVHSCYPKNLNRWMGGTISRKQKCRADFCLLVWCWYTSRLEELEPRTDREALGRALLDICRENSAEETSFCMDALRRASTRAYRKALGRA